MPVRRHEINISPVAEARVKSSLHRNHRLQAVGLLSAVVIAAAFVAFRSVQKPDPPATHSADSSDASSHPGSGLTSNVPLPPIDPGPFSNASHSVAFVGSQVCATCHENEYASYLKTAHSRALAKVAPSAEPPDAEFIQQETGRTYSVYRKDGELRHREAIGVGDETLLLHDMPMKYVIGSGHYSRSYMAESHGFLLESPITWFASTTGRLPDAIQLAKNAMAMTPDRVAERTNSLFVIAESHLRMGATAKAVPHLEKLVQLRRVSEDWNLLAICRLQMGKPAAAIAALEQSVEIDPYRIDTVQMLAELTQQHGTPDDHKQWQKRLVVLKKPAELPR